MFQQMGIVRVRHPVIWVLPCPPVNRYREWDFLRGRRRLRRKWSGRAEAASREEGGGDEWVSGVGIRKMNEEAVCHGNDSRIQTHQ
ncbi:hypothetical protein TSUD_218250 [Trifolium subterraneum]|uniref:Uncharacterized protein n=1 Tax=Trifolium subterraneum TaxID=3900 RepID=A0A2Z6NRH5_TRISU|nr:hypothetical protein TSUD_218250 [Trifolium subterraneum]